MTLDPAGFTPERSVAPECETVDRELRAVVLGLEGLVDRLTHGDDVEVADAESLLDLASALSTRTRSLKERTLNTMLMPFVSPRKRIATGARAK